MKSYFNIFIFGVVLNELLLALQASLALFNQGFPYVPIFLFIASMVISIGLIGMLTTEFKISKINK
ncbi:MULTISPECIES: hypothetical protein [Sphingobacterium]|uniref:hypothetical protein n=1 Tax=Sphingobacterium TaxID=28453 RepID=UPI0011819BCF|nr:MULTISPECIES: hypothetical protein [Sphingobacterium]MCT1530847.1 hypothetical protein [Sphingobacterium daejeonense]